MNLKNLWALSTHNWCANHCQGGWNFFAKKLTLSTILTFFINYEMSHPNCGDECYFNNVRALLHPNVSNENFEHKRSSSSKGPSGGVWATCSNVCSLVWWLCSYKCNNFPFMLAKTIVKDINFYIAPYIQICDNQHKIIFTCKK